MRFLVPVCAFVLSSCASSNPEHRAAEGALGPYSASVTTATTCYVSGQIAPNPDFAKEAEGALRKVERELNRCGLGLGDVTSATVFLTDIALYRAFNDVYARVMPSPYPARTCVAVSALPGGARVEIQMVAAR